MNKAGNRQQAVVNRVKSYKDLIVWQKSFDLSLQIYKITKVFPKDEIYGLVSQMRRCAVSIPSNIAEGYGRNRRKEYVKFLQIGYASGAELETQLLLAKELGYIKIDKYKLVNDLMQEVMKMLNVLIRKLKANA